MLPRKRSASYCHSHPTILMSGGACCHRLLGHPEGDGIVPHQFQVLKQYGIAYAVSVTPFPTSVWGVGAVQLLIDPQWCHWLRSCLNQGSWGQKPYFLPLFAHSQLRHRHVLWCNIKSPASYSSSNPNKKKRMLLLSWSSSLTVNRLGTDSSDCAQALFGSSQPCSRRLTSLKMPRPFLRHPCLRTPWSRLTCSVLAKMSLSRYLEILLPKTALSMSCSISTFLK